MEELFTQEQLNQLDDIIKRLANGQTVNVDDSLRSIYNILANEGWIIGGKNAKYESGRFYRIHKSSNFESLLAGGTFSERYKRKVEQQQQNITQVFYGGNNNVGNNNTIVSENKGSVIPIRQGNTEIERKSILGKLLSFFKCN